MAKRIAYLHCGAALTRVAVANGGQIEFLYVGAARGDEKQSCEPVYGNTYKARVKRIDKTLVGAFVDIGAAQDGFLPLEKETPVREGAVVSVQVRRPPIGAKGAVLTQAIQSVDIGVNNIDMEENRETVPVLVGGAPDATLAPFRIPAMSDIDGVIIDDAVAGRFLQQHAALNAMTVTIDDGAVREMYLADAVDEALNQSEPLPGGARMIFDETEGGCVIDIDAGSAGFAGASSAKVNDRVNQAAATVLANALNRRAIGGAIIVDFLPPSSRAARDTLLLTLKKSGLGANGARIGTMSASGVMTVTRPRRTKSLLEQASETAGTSWVRPGRRLTANWCARHAIDALEAQLRAAPSSRPILRVGMEVSACLDAHLDWRNRLAARYGARFIIETSTTLEERSYDLAD